MIESSNLLQTERKSESKERKKKKKKHNEETMKGNERNVSLNREKKKTWKGPLKRQVRGESRPLKVIGFMSRRSVVNPYGWRQENDDVLNGLIELEGLESKEKQIE